MLAPGARYSECVMSDSIMFRQPLSALRRGKKARDMSVNDAPVESELCDSMTTSLVLAGDIGGTNSRFRLFEVPLDATIEGTDVPGELVFEKIYPNEKFERYRR